MTTKYQLVLTSILATILVIGIGFFMGTYFSHRQQRNYKLPSAFITPADQTSGAPHPSITPSLPKPQTVSQISPDGSKRVVLEIAFNQDNTRTYTFSTTDNTDTDKQMVFTRTLDQTKLMVIPFNTWSPNNKYFFIQEQTIEGIVTQVLAFKATGQPFTDQDKYIDVTALFAKRNTGNTFKEATGWASETLVLINTLRADNTKGPSYWFEIPSKAVVQLSTRF